MKLLSALTKRLLASLRRLQWKLTLAYALSSVVTAVILGLIGLGLLWYLNFRSDLLPNAIAASLTKVTPGPGLFIAESPPNLTALDIWLREVTPGNFLVLNVPLDDTDNPNDTAPAQLGRVVLVAVVDAEGRVLAATPKGILPAGAPLTAELAPEETQRLQAALQGETEPSLLAARNAAGDMVAGAPIFSQAEQQVVGAIFVRLAFPLEEGEFVTGVLRGAILPIAGSILVAGLVAGVLFGFLIARGLTRRLRVLANTADIWSRGDFSVVARDTSGDELGLLAQRLNRMAEQLQALLQARQELAALEERNRLARDLHDSVKQQVFATAMQVGTARELLEHNPDVARSHLSEAEHLVRQAQQELTSLIQELRPAALEGKGLATALRDYVADWSRQVGIAGEVRVQGERPLPLAVEQALFRVAQEALANAARHSQATFVEIHLAWQGTGIVLTVSDNGLGFNLPASGSKGLGLRSMRERIEAIGGELTVQSSPGVGTQVTARCFKCAGQVEPVGRTA